jgi:hypothetical protein
MILPFLFLQVSTRNRQLLMWHNPHSLQSTIQLIVSMNVYIACLISSIHPILIDTLS